MKQKVAASFAIVLALAMILSTNPAMMMPSSILVVQMEMMAAQKVSLTRRKVNNQKSRNPKHRKNKLSQKLSQ